ncbi:hypothetical protein HW132_02005 [Brasilonema sp. CT11]|nr:hypothetical protein [Brasilonema sp. CT11]
MDVSTQKLLQALEAKNDPKLAPIITRAKANYYHDYKSDLMAPIVTLVADLRGAGHEDLAQRAVDGEFDSTKEESDAWAKSSEEKAVFAELLGSRKKRLKPRGFGN